MATKTVGGVATGGWGGGAQGAGRWSRAQGALRVRWGGWERSGVPERRSAARAGLRARASAPPRPAQRQPASGPLAPAPRRQPACTPGPQARLACTLTILELVGAVGVGARAQHLAQDAVQLDVLGQLEHKAAAHRDADAVERQPLQALLPAERLRGGRRAGSSGAAVGRTAGWGRARVLQAAARKTAAAAAAAGAPGRRRQPRVLFEPSTHQRHRRSRAHLDEVHRVPVVARPVHALVAPAVVGAHGQHCGAGGRHVGRPSGGAWSAGGQRKAAPGRCWWDGTRRQRPPAAAAAAAAAGGAPA